MVKLPEGYKMAYGKQVKVEGTITPYTYWGELNKLPPGYDPPTDVSDYTAEQFKEFICNGNKPVKSGA